MRILRLAMDLWNTDKLQAMKVKMHSLLAAHNMSQVL